ncbi:oligopeptidase B [Cavenderia fasciculata]|uniref:Prolyl endopeptidase n=1 Tax=Cavenderia fasciculata TaxID=261658 RepID=F4PR93_CACFS|nr:oligopeptidase B [Cavenderia fasciculata]EGG21293.1 oligopeptidase B [Cavenderia fasciculata]|eukprot:XP_004359143.1 oligopeptidase B [Cavenderia fasciculata]
MSSSTTTVATTVYHHHLRSHHYINRIVKRTFNDIVSSTSAAVSSTHLISPPIISSLIDKKEFYVTYSHVTRSPPPPPPPPPLEESSGSFTTTVLSKLGLNKKKQPIIPFSLHAPPIHHKETIEFDKHGFKWKDDYLWMNNPIEADERVQESIQQENDYADLYGKSVIKHLQSQIKREKMDTIINLSKQKEEDVEGYQYISNKDSYFRKRLIDGQCHELFKNGKEMFEYLKITDLVSFKFAEDQKHFMYGADVGEETYHCFIKVLQENNTSITLDHIPNVVSIEWGKNNEVYYTVPDHLKRPHKLYKRILGSNQPDELILDEPNDSYFLDLVKSKDGKYIFFCSNSKTSSCVYSLRLDDPDQRPKVCIKRKENLEYYVEHNGDSFIIFANIDKKDLSIFVAKDTLENGSIEDLEPLVPTDDNINIRDVDVFDNKLVLCELHNSSPRIRIISKNVQTGRFDAALSKSIDFPKTSTLALGINQGFSRKTIRAYCCEPLIPSSAYDIDIYTYDTTVHTPPSIHGPLALLPSDYTCQKVFVQSKHDPSIQIPLSIIHHRDIKLNSLNPTLIKGYGAYGTILDTGYDESDLPLLKRGWVIAMAHVRGGGEMGRNWYVSGKKEMKKNSILDFVDCAEYLCSSGYTSNNKLVAHGSSAGGVLMGNMALSYGHLFNAIVAKVPFVDILTTMMDESLPLTIHEYGEWGNPSTDKQTFNTILSYDPYFLIDKKNKNIQLPNILVTASLSDIRVPFWQPMRWVAKLRESLLLQNNNAEQRNPNMDCYSSSKQSKQPIILLKIEDCGHFGPKGHEDHMDAMSFETAFMIKSVSDK